MTSLFDPSHLLLFGCSHITSYSTHLIALDSRLNESMLLQYIGEELIECKTVKDEIASVPIHSNEDETCYTPSNGCNCIVVFHSCIGG